MTTRTDICADKLRLRIRASEGTTWRQTCWLVHPAGACDR